MAVSKRTRYEVLRRDGHACRYCGGRAPDVALTVDHVVPTALGGGDEPDNLVAACRDCNAGKSSTSPDIGVVQEVAADAARWARAMEQAAEELRREANSYDLFEAAFYDTWTRWVPYGIDQTLRSLYAAGLPVEQLKEAATVACDAYGIENRRAYFAGVAWKRVNRMQEIARQIIDSEAGRGS